jgi:hypothetical protein
MIDPIFTPIMYQARDEAYAYFDRFVRNLPKGKGGRIDDSLPGFYDNDVDAFRHAYVSGVFTQEFGDKMAKLLGILNEYTLPAQYSHSISPRSRNMDLWNNRVGSRYGKKTRGRKALLKLIHGALKQGELIIDLNDPREYAGATVPKKRMAKPLVSVRKSNTGRNEVYFDLVKRAFLTREQLVLLIESGEYSGYSVKLIRGIKTPVSKRDGKRINNIG